MFSFSGLGFSLLSYTDDVCFFPLCGLRCGKGSGPLAAQTAMTTGLDYRVEHPHPLAPEFQ